MKPIDVAGLWNEAQAAAFFNVSKKTIQSWRAKGPGHGPDFVRLGKPGNKRGPVRYFPEVCVDHARKLLIRSTSDPGGGDLAG